MRMITKILALLGGTFKPGDWSRNPEPEETERIIGEHVRLFSGFG